VTLDSLRQRGYTLAMAELRMRDLTAKTGLSRQAIHFYIEQGLVEPPEKTGETMAYYTPAHVERILLVKKLQEEHFLPLKAIRAMLDDKPGDLSRAQMRVLREVKAKLPATTTAHDPDARVELGALLARTGLARKDVTALEHHGLVKVVRGHVTEDHAWRIELWADVRAAGFTEELGFTPEVLLIFERGVDRMFAEEKRVLLNMAAGLPASRVAGLVERALPLIHTYLARLHDSKVRALFAEVES
jgi:DNA-binding transcriptional MerR regulator